MYPKKNPRLTVAGFILPFDGALVADIRYSTDLNLLNEARTNTEFVAKLAISIVDSFVYMAKLSWGNLNEGVTSKESVERYRLRHSFCPASLRVDKIYRTRDNTHYCYEEGICFSEPIKAKLQDTSATVIIMNLIVINIAPAYQDLSVFQRTFFAYSEQIFCCR